MLELGIKIKYHNIFFLPKNLNVDIVKISSGWLFLKDDMEPHITITIQDQYIAQP